MLNNEVDTKQECGIYKVTYKVTDSQGSKYNKDDLCSCESKTGSAE
ncbi:MAG: hypothetical protein ACLT1J_11120 [Mediterraneibacter gnavus]